MVESSCGTGSSNRFGMGTGVASSWKLGSSRLLTWAFTRSPACPRETVRDEERLHYESLLQISQLTVIVTRLLSLFFFYFGDGGRERDSVAIVARVVHISGIHVGSQCVPRLHPLAATCQHRLPMGHLHT